LNTSCTILVSGKGGTGKTTISALLIKALVEAGERPVLAVDADPNANLHEALGLSLSETLGSMREEAFTRSIPPGMDRTGYIKYRFRKVLVESEGFDLISMGRPEGSGCYCFPNSLLSECMRMLEPDYRFVVVDAEAGMEHISRGTIRHPDLLLIVSDPGIRGIRTARRIRDLAVSLGLSDVPMYCILNRVKDGHAADAEDPGSSLPMLGSIPEDPAVEEADLHASPIVSIPPMSPARQAVRECAHRIVAICNEKAGKTSE
jgi:CO dehydrogenase maturation factor